MVWVWVLFWYRRQTENSRFVRHVQIFSEDLRKIFGRNLRFLRKIFGKQSGTSVQKRVQVTSLALRLSGCVRGRLRSSLVPRLSGCEPLWFRGCMAAKVSGSEIVYLQGVLVLKLWFLRGFMVLMLSCCEVLWLRRYVVAKL